MMVRPRSGSTREARRQEREHVDARGSWSGRVPSRLLQRRNHTDRHRSARASSRRTQGAARRDARGERPVPPPLPIATAPLTVCLSGALGAVGRVLAPAVVAADDLVLQSAVARREAGPRSSARRSAATACGVGTDGGSRAGARPSLPMCSSTTRIRRWCAGTSRSRSSGEVAGRDRHERPPRRGLRRDRRGRAARRASAWRRAISRSRQRCSSTWPSIAARHVPAFEVIEHNGARRSRTRPAARRASSPSCSRASASALADDALVQLIGPPRGTGRGDRRACPCTRSGCPVRVPRVEVVFGAPWPAVDASARRSWATRRSSSRARCSRPGASRAFSGLVRGLDSLLF